MKIWRLNFSNSARILKCLTLTTFTLVVCLYIYSIHFILRPRQLTVKNKLARQKQILKHPAVSYNHSVCVGFMGRLGNNMFQFASAYGIAHQKGMRVKVGVHDRVAQTFNLSVMVSGSRNYCAHARVKHERVHCSYDPQMLNISTSRDIMLMEYLQSWKYFIHAQHEIRQQFIFKKPVIDRAREKFNMAIKHSKHNLRSRLNKKHNVTSKNNKTDKVTYVGIHVRHGDMLASQNNKRNQISSYNIAPRGYILRAMNRFMVKYHQVTFVIASDDMKWVKTQFVKYRNILSLAYLERNPAAVDMAILSLCNHTIMTTGTFGWWSAWLAGGEVVYYKHYIKEGTKLRRQFSKDYSDFFYPGWIPME